MEIKSFGSKKIEQFIKTGALKKSCKWKNLAKIAQRKIDMILFADGINDLLVPPSNRLEKLSGNLKGYWAIRINDQFRVIFKCHRNLIFEINIVDYH
jgi:toxin HigB-1